MAQYQNIFTQVQVRGAARSWHSPARRRMPRARDSSRFTYWVGKIGDAQIGPIYLGTLGFVVARLRRHRDRDHRSQHVGVGELGSGRFVREICRGSRSSRRLRSTGSRIPPLEEGGWWLMAGFFLTTSILLWWAAHVSPRARARHGHACRLGLCRGDLAVSGARALSGRC